jgi:NADH dehydrogenase FAD-containing subunit
VPGVFVVDVAASVVCDGRPMRGVAQTAIQERRYVGRLIARQLKTSCSVRNNPRGSRTIRMTTPRRGASSDIVEQMAS